jgi:L-asparaginase
VQQGKYATSAQLKEIGVVSGNDMTTEAAIAKMMFLLSKGFSQKEVSKLLTISLRGEIS